MPQQPPSQSPDPAHGPEPTGRAGGTPPHGARPTPPAGGPPAGPGVWPAQESGPFVARPQAPGRGPAPGYAPGAGQYGPPPGPGGAWSGAGRAYAPPPAGPQPTQAFAGPARSSASQPTQSLGGFTTGSTTGSTATGATATVTAEPKKRDLTIPKLAAGAGAAATSAVMGSFFGELGTVGGAAVGSLVSAVATTLYQRSLERTGQTVKAKIKLPGGRTVDVEGKTEVPAPPIAPGGETGQARVFVTPGDQPTEVMSAVPAAETAIVAGPRRSRRRLLMMAGFTALVFALGMLAITGIELLKGSPISTASSSTSSERSGGTSLGTVLSGSDAASTETSDTETTSATETEEPSDEETTPAPDEDEDTDTTAERGTPLGEEDAEPTTTRSRATPTPTPTPDAGTDPDGGADAGAQSGGGADVPDEQQ